MPTVCEGALGYPALFIGHIYDDMSWVLHWMTCSRTHRNCLRLSTLIGKWHRQCVHGCMLCFIFGPFFRILDWTCFHGLVSRSFSHMMTLSNGNIFRVTGHLCGEFTCHQWIPLTKANDAELWCFLWSEPWINGWVNNREAGDLRRHRAHYDVIVMN